MNNGINNIIKFNIVAACLMSSYMIVRRFLLYTSIYSKQIVSGYVDVKRVNNETKEKTPTAQIQRDHSYCITLKSYVPQMHAQTSLVLAALSLEYGAR